MDFKERENRYLDDIVDLEEKLSSRDRIVYKIGQSIKTIHILGKKPNKVYHPFLKAGLGYQNPKRVKKAIAAQPKMVESSSSVRRPKSKDANLKKRVLLNTKSKSTSPNVKKISSSVSVVSDKNDTLNSTGCQTNASVLKEKTVNVVNDGSNLVCVSCGKDVFMISHDKYVAHFALSVDSRVIQIILWMVDSGCSKHMTGNLKLLRNFVEKFMGTVCFGNDNFATINRYRDYIQGNLTICHVYYAEILEHNLFFIRKFCDGDLEVAFRSNTCYVWNLEGEDFLIGSHDSNLYTISISKMAASSPVCLINSKPDLNCSNFQDSSEELNDTLSKDTSPSSSIIIEDHNPLPIVSSSEAPIENETITPVVDDNSDEQVQEDVTEFDGNTFINPFAIPEYEKPESSSNYQDPDGFVEPDFPYYVYRLKKALYGLKEALRAWYDKLSSFFVDDHFTKGEMKFFLGLQPESTQFYREPQLIRLSTPNRETPLKGQKDLSLPQTGCHDGKLLHMQMLTMQGVTMIARAHMEEFNIWETSYNSKPDLNCLNFQDSSEELNDTLSKVSSSEAPIKNETITPVVDDNSDEQVQEDVTELDGNTFINPFATPEYEKPESSSNYQDPDGFVEPDFPYYVYRLKKALYGLKEALRAWYDKLSSFFVDDHFTKGEMKFFLGLQVHHSPCGIFINQSQYTMELLKKHGME
nr:integrase, catalytic region, zinc finger, CCHC-type, peptidase aspartic, catalytic [Tanacetum cinerariifolium]